jgi:hypothetical protein
MAVTKAASMVDRMSVARLESSAWKMPLINFEQNESTKDRLTGVMAPRASSNAVVAVPRLERSVLTMAGTPPTGRAERAGLMVTIPVRAETMMGFKPSTASTMEVPSSRERGRGVRLCEEL